MTHAGVPTRSGFGRENRPVGAGSEPPAAASSSLYYILYYAEATSSGVMGPMKRARYATAHEAVDRAMVMRRNGAERPVEIRDPQDRLITCEMMGWKLPALVPAASAVRPVTAAPAAVRQPA